MKNKLTVLFVALCTLFSLVGNAQEVVHLKNGSAIKGNVIEQDFEKGTIKIETADGSVFVYNTSDLEKIEKAPQQQSTRQSDQSSYTTEYRGGYTWQTYEDDGLIISQTASEEDNGYGKWFRIDVVIVNGTDSKIDFNANYVYALSYKDEKERDMEVFNYYDFMNRVRRVNNFANVSYAIAQGLNNTNAGYNTTTYNTRTTYNTNSNYSGTIDMYDNYGYSAYGSYSGSRKTHGVINSSTTVTTYDAELAARQREEMNRKVAQFSSQLQSNYNSYSVNYLTSNTLNRGDAISGFFYIKRERCDYYNVVMTIQGKRYLFAWRKN